MTSVYQHLHDLADAWWLFDKGYLDGAEMNKIVEKARDDRSDW